MILMNILNGHFKNTFVPGINQRLWRVDKNFMLLLTGPTGSGKSYTALSIAEQGDKNFTIDQCIFTPKEFMRVLNSGKIKKGSYIIFDEAGVGISSREWQSLKNKLLGFILQIFRDRNLCVIFTTPSKSFMDKQGRILSHGLMETQRIDRKNNQCYVKFKWIDGSKLDSKGEPYKYTSRVVLDDGLILQVPEFPIPKPSDKLIKLYREKKEYYGESLRNEIEEKLNRIESKKDKILHKEPTHQCKKCGYEWAYKGNRIKFRCPSCDSVVAAKNHIKPI